MNDGRSFESYVRFVFSSLLNMKDEGVVVGRDVQLPTGNPVQTARFRSLPQVSAAHSRA